MKKFTRRSVPTIRATPCMRCCGKIPTVGAMTEGASSREQKASSNAIMRAPFNADHAHIARLKMACPAQKFRARFASARCPMGAAARRKNPSSSNPSMLALCRADVPCTHPRRTFVLICRASRSRTRQNIFRDESTHCVFLIRARAMLSTCGAARQTLTHGLIAGISMSVVRRVPDDAGDA